MTSAIPQDAQTVDNDGFSESEAAEALLAKFMKESPEEDNPADNDVDKDEGKTNTDAEDDSEDDSDDSGDEDESPEEDEDSEEGEEEDETDKAENIIDDDKDAYVKIKVDGEERTVSVRDLKRLYGQEASLTRKSQEVSKQRKQAEELGATYVAGLTGLLQRATQKAAPYKQIDFLAAAQQLKPEDLNTLRQEAQTAFEEERYLAEELNTFMENLKQSRQAQLIEKGREAVKELQRDIPGWNEKVYNDVRHFAISSGLDADIVDNLVDAAAIKLIHKAMLFDKGKSGVVTKKKNNAPKKVIKTSKSTTASTKDLIGDKTKAKKALKQLELSGSTDDAAEAFLARWQSSDD
jgi:hypothetical protein